MTLLQAFNSKIYEVFNEERLENSGRGHYEYGGLRGYDSGEEWIEGIVMITFPFYYPEDVLEKFFIDYEDEIMDRLCENMPNHSETEIIGGLQIVGYTNRLELFFEYEALNL